MSKIIKFIVFYLVGNGWEFGYMKSFIVGRCVGIYIDNYVGAVSVCEEILEYSS